MKKTSVSSNSLGAFLNPGASNYGENGAIYNKGWCSERIPHPSSTAGINGRRHISSASALATPFYSGRALPSKWEDAERWICSPLASYPPGVCNNSCVGSQFVEQRRPKSKSGPIAPPAIPQQPPPALSSSSSAIGCYHYSLTAAVEAPPGRVRGTTVVGSPFSTGVLEADRVFRGSVGSSACNGWMDLVSESSSSSSQEEKLEKAESSSSPVVSRRDMATQMSPDATSPNQSPPPREREASPLYPSPPVVVSIVEPRNGSHCRQQQVREVKIDRQARMIKRPKRRVSRVSRREPRPEVEDDYMNSGASASTWDISEPAMNLSKLLREEAKIAAWEKLQKAKAEAAIRKLEVKLEKKKSDSMDKILNKLQTAQLRAQEMRSSVSSKEGNHISKNPLKINHLVRRHTFMNPFMSCFARRVDCRNPSAL